MLVAALNTTGTLAGRPSPTTRVATRRDLPERGPRAGMPRHSGRPVANAYFAGEELGQGPVMMLIANAANLRRGIVSIAQADRNNPLGPADYYVF